MPKHKLYSLLVYLYLSGFNFCMTANVLLLLKIIFIRIIVFYLLSKLISFRRELKESIIPCCRGIINFSIGVFFKKGGNYKKVAFF